MRARMVDGSDRKAMVKPRVKGTNLDSRIADAALTVLSDPTEGYPIDSIRFWPPMDGVSAAYARFVRHRFRPHTHETLMLGLIEAGTKRFARERQRYVATPGSISVVNPGEMHTGERYAGQELRYRALYVPAALLDIADDRVDRDADDVLFEIGTINDTSVYRALIQAHAAITSGQERLTSESLLLEALSALVRRHAVRAAQQRAVSRSPRAIRLAQELIRARFAEELPIHEVARAASLSVSHLMHAFRRFVGLPIHAYQIQVRIEAAKRLLASGHSPAYVALEVGFADQSHLTHRFKDLIGTSPGEYQRAIMAAS